MRLELDAVEERRLERTKAKNKEWREAQAESWVERFDRRGTEPNEPFEPFEFFQNSGFFLRKFKNFRKI